MMATVFDESEPKRQHLRNSALFQHLHVYISVVQAVKTLKSVQKRRKEAQKDNRDRTAFNLM